MGGTTVLEGQQQMVQCKSWKKRGCSGSERNNVSSLGVYDYFLDIPNVTFNLCPKHLLRDTFPNHHLSKVASSLSPSHHPVYRLRVQL